MPLDWSPFVEFVRRNDRFLLMTHVRPDGDALGSELALAEALRVLGKSARAVIASNLPPRYHFLNANRQVEQFRAPGDQFRDAGAVIVVDTGTWNQLGEFGPFLRTLAVPRLVIDHHRTQDDLGAVRLVDTSAEACGRLVREAIAALGVPLTEPMATALFIALAMDTGWFHHGSTTAASFGLAEELVRAGADPNRIYERLYERDSLARMRLMGLLLGRLRTVADGRVAVSEVLQSDFAATRSVPGDTEDMVNLTRGLEGVEVGVLLIEQAGGDVKVSFRSRSVDVAQVAERFGGGGHKQASGATLPGPIDVARERALAAIVEALG
jgi:phosphoesterase RecJ-like protein